MNTSASQAKSIETVSSTTYFQKRLLEREISCGLTDQLIAGLDREELYNRLEMGIGSTEINVIQLPNGNTLFQKNETCNPTESHYDRCYIELIKKLEEGGTIRPGDVLLETTSGSAGVSFAWICKKLGYESVVFMPSFVPEPRIVEVQNLATAVYLNDDRHTYLLACAKDMVNYYKANKDQVRRDNRNIFMPNHSQDFLTPKIFARIMDEVTEQIEGRKIDFFIGGIGNGSTLLGVGERLKAINPEAKVIAFEPISACPFYKRERSKWGKSGLRLVEDAEVPDSYSFHRLPGTGTYGNVNFPFMDQALERNLIDDICPVHDSRILDSVNYNDELLEQDKLGNSSLVSRYIAEALAGTVQDKNIFVLAYDRADRYGSPRFV